VSDVKLETYTPPEYAILAAKNGVLTVIGNGMQALGRFV
jgi:hypothetical protein